MIFGVIQTYAKLSTSLMVETSGKTLMVGQNYRRLPVAV